MNNRANLWCFQNFAVFVWSSRPDIHSNIVSTNGAGSGAVLYLCLANWRWEKSSRIHLKAVIQSLSITLTLSHIHMYLCIKSAYKHFDVEFIIHEYVCNKFNSKFMIKFRTNWTHIPSGLKILKYYFSCTHKYANLTKILLNEAL